MILCNLESAHSTLPRSPDYVSFTHSECGPHSNGTLSVEDIQKRKLQYRYVVCIHGSLKNNYSTYQRLVEQVEVNSIFGADHFALYNWTGSPILRPYIDYYVQRGKMTLYDWQIPSFRGPTHNGGQLSLINDCLYRYMYRSKYLVFVDIDEFIVPRKHLSWDSMLNAATCHNYGTAVFRNVFFETRYPDDEEYLSNKTLRQFDDMLTLRKSTRDQSPLKCGRRSKIITRPESVILGTVHVVEASLAPSCCMDPNIGLLHHYRDTRILENERVVKDKTMYIFADRIVSSVQKVLADVASQLRLRP